MEQFILNASRQTIGYQFDESSNMKEEDVRVLLLVFWIML